MKLKLFFLLLSSFISLHADEESPLSYRGYVGLNSTFYTNIPSDKNQNSFTALQRVELDYKKENLQLHSTLYAQEAYYDFAESAKETGRSFARVDELFLKYELENSSFKMGKSIEFWGALELYNATDVFNTADFRNDMMQSDNKLGSYNINYSYYTDNGTFSIILKLYEESEAMAKYAYPYYFLPKEQYIADMNKTFNFRYDSELLSEHSVGKPSLYIKYNASTDFSLDYAFVYERGYDSQRYIQITLPKTPSGDIPFNSTIYQVDKFLTFNTLAVENTLYKFEGLYAHVLDKVNVSDYTQLSFGVEHTLTNFSESDSDLGLITEYYYYKTLESGAKNSDANLSNGYYSDLTLFQNYQNDLFLGVRITFNDEGDATFIGGVVLDTQYKEQLYTAEYERRLFEVMKLKLSYQNFQPSTTTLTPFARIGKHQKMSFDVSYHF